MADLIDQETKTWRVDLVRKLYQGHDGEEILYFPLPRTTRIEDKLLWKHSTSGKYQVNKAYHLINVNQHTDNQKHGHMEFLQLFGTRFGK